MPQAIVEDHRRSGIDEGYYLLGRVVAKLRGKSSPIDAYASHLLSPLGITRIRSAVDLLADQAKDEARYQAAAIGQSAPSDLQVATSQMTPDQPAVAQGYGDDHLSLSQGSGGLSGAVTACVPGGKIAASQQLGTVDVFTVSTDGTLSMLSLQGGQWSRSALSTEMGEFVPGAGLAGSPRFGAPAQTDVYAVDSGGQPMVYSCYSGDWNTSPTIIGIPS